MKKSKIFAIIIFIILSIIICKPNLVYADELTDNINDQISNMDFSDLEIFFNQLEIPNNTTFSDFLGKLINGDINVNFGSIFEYLLNQIFFIINDLIPLFISVIAISLFISIINGTKGGLLKSSTSDVIFFVCYLSIIILTTGCVGLVFNNTKNTIEKLTNLTEIMSPIILTLMIASGGNVSAGIYKPAVSFLSSGIVSIVSNVALPAVGIMIIFTILSNFSEKIKLKKFTEFISSAIKWILGISITIFTLFMTVQGITSATYDGISLRATKYAISNSIPIIGGFLKDGFDIVVAGSVIIKNSVGIIGVFALFYIVLSPVIYIVIVSLLLKLTASIIEPISDSRISDFCMSLSKSISYLNTCTLMVGFMVFILTLIMTFTANAFI